MYQENQINVDNTPNPTYGVMGRKVTRRDSAEMQCKEAIKPIPMDLTPIKRMDDLRSYNSVISRMDDLRLYNSVISLRFLRI